MNSSRILHVNMLILSYFILSYFIQLLSNLPATPAKHALGSHGSLFLSIALLAVTRSPICVALRPSVISNSAAGVSIGEMVP